MLRVWIAEKKLHCSMKVGMYRETMNIPEEKAWGKILADVARHFANALPIPGETFEGALINHTDAGLADPAFNSSGVPWHASYYQVGYPCLQRVKARWDPRHVFRHALSIRAA
jgi:hypothetical protein